MRDLTQALGYETSGNFFPAAKAAAFESLPFSHLCRKWIDQMGFKGVYVLGAGEASPPVPVVAVFNPESESDAKAIHRLVWNQDFVPFILVQSPSCIRLYSGFDYREAGSDGETGLIEPLRDFNRVREALGGFHSSEIDGGALWSKWGQHVNPAKRVDWRLLKSLGKLALKLRNQGLTKDISHAFIGRYVYLRYLLDRGFLSPRKLAKWNLEKEQIFSHKATLKAFREVNARLDDETDGLNGSIFPFSVSTITKDQLQTVASAFAGEDVSSGQQVFEFFAYDFSFIPIETLSVIYEQFLHEPDTAITGTAEIKSKSKGRAEGAYYTPIPLVNFMIQEMEMRKQLLPGMKVLDPSCGSGAFLVQTYRMLIERGIRESGRENLPPSELRRILTTQIYGVDRDADACRIAEMSLLVTLLDYVDPPDLEGKYKGFLLPSLRGNNIFEADFFDPQSEWATAIKGKQQPLQFDWVIGNPPWKELTKSPKDVRDQLALSWMKDKGAPPTGGNQVAEAFVWKCQPLMKESAVAAMVLPAMTLFKNESEEFRRRLFSTVNVWSVVNFSNLNHVLFSGRTIVPAMTLFFEKPLDGKASGDLVRTFAPMVINQEANRPLKAGRQLDTWNLVVNGSEVREIPRNDLLTGEGLVWKIAMWGSFRDRKLLAKLKSRFSKLEKFCSIHRLLVAEGFQLREDPLGVAVQWQGGRCIVKRVIQGGFAEKAGIQSGDLIKKINKHDVASLSAEAAMKLLHGSEGGRLKLPVRRAIRPDGAELELLFADDKIEHRPELKDEWELSFRHLKNCGRIASFPDKVLSRIPASRCWVRKGRADLPMAASSPPHLITDVGRRFAVFSNEFIAVPARQIGISGASAEVEPLLRALSLFLTSDFCLYHQFFHAPQWGIEHSIATLRVLKELPIPDLSAVAGRWAEFHEEIAERTPSGETISPSDQATINRLVFEVLDLRPDEQCIVEDFVRMNFLMIKGKVENAALRIPNESEVADYLETLKIQLDDYMADDDEPVSHALTGVSDGKTMMIEIVLCVGEAASPVVRQADELEARELGETRAKLLKKHRQWIYFDRNLRLYSKGRLYLFKALQCIQWTRRQAILDADELIAEALGD